LFIVTTIQSKNSELVRV